MAKKKKAKKNAPSKEYLKTLNTGWGVLNPIADTLTSKNFDSDDSSWFDLARETINRTFSASTLAGTGPYVGIVLRDEGTTDINIEDKKGWAPAAYSHRIKDDVNGGVDVAKSGNMPKLRQLRVRIPELHAALPIPERLPKRSQNSDEKDQKAHRVINLYPVFIAQNTFISATEVQPGSLVWVDFQNRNTMQGGIFLSEIESRVTMEDLEKGSKDVVEEDPYQKCLDEGGSPETCKALSTDEQDWTSGGNTSNLQIKRAVPVIQQGTGFPYDSITVIKEGETKEAFKERIEGFSKSKEYTTYFNSVFDGSDNKTVDRRPSFWSYGTAKRSQTDTFGGATIHKLAKPRMEALQEMWRNYYNTVILKSLGAQTYTPEDSSQAATAASKALPAFASTAIAAVEETGNVASEASLVIQVQHKDKKVDLSSQIRLNSSFRDGSKYPLTAIGIKKWFNSMFPKDGKDHTINLKKVAYSGVSNHSLGLAIDFGGNGLFPTPASDHGFDSPDGSKTKKDFTWSPQFDSPFYIFLLKYGWLFGLYPYKAEPWHWELMPPRQAWHNSEEYAQAAPDYNTYYNSFYEGSDKITIKASDLKTNADLIADEKLREIYKTELDAMGYKDEHKFVYAVICDEVSKKGKNAGSTLSRVKPSSKNYKSYTIFNNWFDQNGLSALKFSGDSRKFTAAEQAQIRQASNDPKLDINWFAVK